jgi:hypothetical protein
VPLRDEHQTIRTDTFEHTISGLLKKRADLFGTERLRDRMAEIKNDIHAINRVLQSQGYSGDLDAAMPRKRRDVIFGPRRADKGHPVETPGQRSSLVGRESPRALSRFVGRTAGQEVPPPTRKASIQSAPTAT